MVGNQVSFVITVKSLAGAKIKYNIVEEEGLAKGSACRVAKVIHDVFIFISEIIKLIINYNKY